jgi:hypothetical protein
MDLRVFLKESNPNPLTMATLRGRASSSRPTNSTLPCEIETAVMQEVQQSESGPILVSYCPLSGIKQPANVAP